MEPRTNLVSTIQVVSVTGDTPHHRRAAAAATAPVHCDVGAIRESPLHRPSGNGSHSHRPILPTKPTRPAKRCRGTGNQMQPARPAKRRRQTGNQMPLKGDGVQGARFIAGRGPVPSGNEPEGVNTRIAAKLRPAPRPESPSPLVAVPQGAPVPLGPRDTGRGHPVQSRTRSVKARAASKRKGPRPSGRRPRAAENPATDVSAWRQPQRRRTRRTRRPTWPPDPPLPAGGRKPSRKRPPFRPPPG